MENKNEFIHPEDILEFTLNKGTASASRLYGITEKEVQKIVNEFEFEMYYHCSCAYSDAVSGGTSMCFNCDHRRVVKNTLTDKFII